MQDSKAEQAKEYRSRAEGYRSKAQEARAISDKMASPELREFLRGVAGDYQKLADTMDMAAATLAK
jgi:hypothetical protein